MLIDRVREDFWEWEQHGGQPKWDEQSLPGADTFWNQWAFDLSLSEPLHELLQVRQAVQKQGRLSTLAQKEGGTTQGVSGVWGKCYLHPSRLWQVVRVVYLINRFQFSSLLLGCRVFSHFDNKKGNQNSLEQHRQVVKFVDGVVSIAFDHHRYMSQGPLHVFCVGSFSGVSVHSV